jgi:hypothetical protein
MRNLQEAIGILLRENDNLPTVDRGHMMTSAEHDMIHLGGPEPEALPDEVVKRLDELGVFWSTEYDCWSTFT